MPKEKKREEKFKDKRELAIEKAIKDQELEDKDLKRAEKARSEIVDKIRK